MRLGIITVVFVAVSAMILALWPTGPDKVVTTPQNASRFLRDSGDAASFQLQVEIPAEELAALDIDEPEEVAFLHTVDPRTFLTPYADSVLVDHPEWICDTPVPDGALHVATGGSDGNPGTADAPLATITEAMNRATPGQNVVVREGEYRESVVISGRSGSPEAWITLRSHPGERATIVADVGRDAIAFRRGSSYINVACFELAGPTQLPEAIPSSPSELRDQRLGGASYSQIPKNYGTGVDIGDQADVRAGRISHHVRVIANEIHDFAEMGISAVEVDHITIAGNVSYRNAKYSCHAGSGIGLGYMMDVGGPDNPDGYRNYVVGNVSYANENRSLQCFTDNLGPVVTDGNGIIIDLNNQNGYSGRTLIADNVVFGNGGRGILVFKSDRVDVVNNVSYHNAFTENLMGRSGPHPEIAVSGADDVRVYNNIAIPRDGNTAFVEASSDVDKRSNLLRDPGMATDLFVAPGTDPSADFTLLPEAGDLSEPGIPFLVTVDPDGQPVVASPVGVGTIYNTGVIAS